MSKKLIINLSKFVDDLDSMGNPGANGCRVTHEGKSYFVILCNDEAVYRDMMNLDKTIVNAEPEKGGE